MTCEISDSTMYGISLNRNEYQRQGESWLHVVIERGIIIRCSNKTQKAHHTLNVMTESGSDLKEGRIVS